MCWWIDRGTKEQHSVKPDDPNFDAEFPNKLRNMTATALFAIFAMTAYALSTGIIQVMHQLNFAATITFINDLKNWQVVSSNEDEDD